MRPSAIRSSSDSRRGGILICILACLAIVSSLVSLTVQSALRNRREIRTQHHLRQTELLLTAGIQRATEKLAQDSSYEGERWQLSSTVFPNYEKAEVDILGTPAANGTSRMIRVIARLSVSDSQVLQRSHSFVVPSQLPNGKE